MAQSIKFDASVIRAGSKTISSAAAQVSSAVTSVNKAKNNKRWECYEKNQIAANLEITRELMKKLNKRVESFASACTKTANAFEDAEKKFIDTQKNIAKQYKASSAGAIKIFGKALELLNSLMLKLWSMIAKNTPARMIIAANPFLGIPGIVIVKPLERILRDRSEAEKKKKKDKELTVIFQVDDKRRLDDTVMKGQPYGDIKMFRDNVIPQKGELTFEGWYTAPNCGGNKITAKDICNGNITLYGGWSVEVTFETNGGTPATFKKSIIVGEKYGVPKQEEVIKNNLRLSWWTENNGKGTRIIDDDKCNISEPHTLYAMWACSPVGNSPIINSKFFPDENGKLREYKGEFKTHHGVDMSEKKGNGTDMKAIVPGTIVKVPNDGSYGNRVTINGDDGYYYLYGHLSSINEAVGPRVMSGESIGTMGSTGTSGGVHLHFEARTSSKNNAPENPEIRLKKLGIPYSFNIG